MLRPFYRKNVKKSPITDNPLRNPAQSLDDQMLDVIGEQGLPLVVAVSACLSFLAGSWYHWYVPNRRPDLETLFCGAVILYCGVRFYAIIRKLKRLKIGRDGEKVVGQYLDEMRENGYRIFHDVRGGNFNIDHVIIGPQGIFTIETKTYSKPAQGKASVYFDGKSISANGYKPDRNPIEQALAQSRWLGEQIQASTGHLHSVKPVVVFPGWFVTASSEAKSSSVWVLNPKALPKFIDKAPRQLKTEEVKMIAYHLSRYIRASHKDFN